MADEQGSNDEGQTLLPVNDTMFMLDSRGDDYILYHAHKRRTLGDIIVDVFLEQVPGKGWWGAVRLNGRFRIQLCLDRRTLFPTPEIALLATEEFLSNEARVRAILDNMRWNERDLQTVQDVPPRPAEVDPEKYFSPVRLEVDGNNFTLYRLTKIEACYRSWPQRHATGITIDLHLVHRYWKGWKAALRFPGQGVVEFEPAVNQLFPTPEKALETLLAFCSEEDNVREATQRAKELGPQDHIAIRNEVVPIVTAKPPLHVNNVNFVWKQRISAGELYQAKRARFVRFTRVHIQLVETWRNEWLGRVQFAGIEGVYFEKEQDVGFPTPEEAFGAVTTFLALKKGIQMLRAADAKRLPLECQLGRYDQMMSVSASVARDN